MRKTRAVVAGAIIAVGVTVGGVAIAHTAQDDAPTRSEAGPYTPEVVTELEARDQPLLVANPETGRGSGGTLRRSDLDRQSDRVDALLDELGIGSGDARWDEAARAAMVVEAAEVVDENDEVIGYLGTRFIPVEDFDDASSAARATLDRLSRR